MTLIWCETESQFVLVDGPNDSIVWRLKSSTLADAKAEAEEQASKWNRELNVDAVHCV